MVGDAPDARHGLHLREGTGGPGDGALRRRLHEAGEPDASAVDRPRWPLSPEACEAVWRVLDRERPMARVTVPAAVAMARLRALDAAADGAGPYEADPAAPSGPTRAGGGADDGVAVLDLRLLCSGCGARGVVTGEHHNEMWSVAFLRCPGCGLRWGVERPPG